MVGPVLSLLIRGTVFLLMTWWLWQLSTLHLAQEWHVEQEVRQPRDPENHRFKPMTSVEMNNIGRPMTSPRSVFPPEIRDLFFCTEYVL